MIIFKDHFLKPSSHYRIRSGNINVCVAIVELEQSIWNKLHFSFPLNNKVPPPCLKRLVPWTSTHPCPPQCDFGHSCSLLRAICYAGKHLYHLDFVLIILANRLQWLLYLKKIWHGPDYKVGNRRSFCLFLMHWDSRTLKEVVLIFDSAILVLILNQLMIAVEPCVYDGFTRWHNG